MGQGTRTHCGFQANGAGIGHPRLRRPLRWTLSLHPMLGLTYGGGLVHGNLCRFLILLAFVFCASCFALSSMINLGSKHLSGCVFSLALAYVKSLISRRLII